jgi:nitrite reductase (NADH) small subunit
MNAMSSVWVTLCQESDLVVGSGVCALLENAGQAQQVAIFREATNGPVYVISNYDPLGGAYVMSRGIIGSVGDKLVVASPLYKQHFCLADGQCLEDPSVRIPAWPARIENGQVQIQVA